MQTRPGAVRAPYALVQNSETGAGVFAKRPLLADEILAVIPALQFDRRLHEVWETERIAQCFLAHPADPQGYLLMLDPLTLCQISDAPNLVLNAVFHGSSGWRITAQAARNIGLGDELTRARACSDWTIADHPLPPGG